MAYQKKRSKVFRAKWPGECKNCGGKWSKGAELVYENGVVVHDVCPTNGKAQSKAQFTGRSPMDMLKGKNVPTQVEEEGVPYIEKAFTPSSYQQSIFDWIVDPQRWAVLHETAVKMHAVVEAVAGSGKTTTIVKALELLPTTMRVLFLAYNRHIVKELRERLAKYEHIEVATTHSFGLSVIRKSEYFDQKDGVDEEKLSYIMDEFWPVKKYVEVENADGSKEKVEVPAEVRGKNKVYRQATRKIVALVKATLTDYNDADAVLDMIDRYSINLEEEDETVVLDKLPVIMDKSIENISVVDFEDMIYLPVVHKAYEGLFEEYDFILVDETQDLNACQVELILKSLAPDGRVIAVGDRKQSLYGFRGADVDAIPNLIKRLDAQVLPLSISYRCPASHVRAVQGLVPQIEPSPTAKEGILGEVAYKDLLYKLTEGDMVLCRTNAPLVKPAFNCIKKGMKAIIRGKDIGKELVNYIDKFEAGDSLPRLEILMTEYTETQVQRLIDNGKELAAEAMMDKYSTILAVMNECRTVVELKTKVEALFSDGKVGVVFSSVHRSKGLEAERVFVLNREQMPHPKAKEEWEKEQEYNIMYVAGTRSTSELYYVIGNEKDLLVENA